MLDNIKSSFFYKIVFSFIKEKSKLKIVKYTKNLQKKIDINLLHYKYFTGKFIVYEKYKKRKKGKKGKEKKLKKEKKKKEKSTIMEMIVQYMKGHILMEKEMEKEKNIIIII